MSSLLWYVSNLALSFSGFSTSPVADRVIPIYPFCFTSNRLRLQGSDGGVKLYWGIAADGSVVICDDKEVIKAGCAKSYAPFPTGIVVLGVCLPEGFSVRLKEIQNILTC